MNYGKKLLLGLLCTLLFFLLPVPGSAEPGDLVYVIPVEGTIDPALASFVDRIYDEAEDLGAARVILEIDTYGGYIDSEKPEFPEHRW